jgi:hypothetical protein
MSTKTYIPYKVKDISLAEWGRKEIRLAEVTRVKAPRNYCYRKIVDLLFPFTLSYLPPKERIYLLRRIVQKKRGDEN